MKNIAFVLPAGSLPVPTTKGGAIEGLLQLLIDENEKHRKFHFHILMCKNKNDRTEYIYNFKNTTFYDFYESNFALKKYRVLNAISKRVNNFSLPFYSPYDKFVAKTLDKITPDLIIVEGAISIGDKLLSKKFDKEKLVYHIHHQMLPKRDPSKFFGQIWCVSEFLKNDWLKWGKCKNPIEVSVLPNAIDTEKFNKQMTQEEKSALRKSLGIKDEDFVVIYVGRLIKEKGVDRLIKAISTLDNKNIKLMICGQSFFEGSTETEYTRFLRELSKPIRDQIIFTGYIKNSELYKYYKISNLFVLPSVCEEAAGLVVLESACCGVPQIITKSGGAPEYASKDAIVVEKDDNLTSSLSDAISNAYNCKNMADLSPHKVNDAKFYFDKFALLAEKNRGDGK